MLDESIHDSREIAESTDRVEIYNLEKSHAKRYHVK